MTKRIAAIIIVLVMVFGTCNAFAAADPSVSIVNPSNTSTVYSDNLLVSVKVTKPATIRVSVYQVMKAATVEGGSPTAISVDTYEKNLKADAANKLSLTRVSVTDPVTETYTANLSFYTKKLESITPGVYIIKAETLDSAGKILYSSESYVGVKAKDQEASDKDIFETEQSGTMQFFKTILKGIFGN